MSQSQMTTFESDEEDILFMSKEASPLPRRKLKRLKKGKDASNNDAKKSTDVAGPIEYMQANEVESINQRLSTTSPRPHDEELKWMGLENFCTAANEIEEDDDDKKEDDQIADRHIEIESPKVTDKSSKNPVPEGCNHNEELENPVNADEYMMEATPCLHEASSSPLEEKKKRRKKSNENLKRASQSSDAMEKRILKKKKSELEEIHAESQRLLRETPDASFKPLPTISKPISSVLEKIRLRKLQLVQKAGKGSVEVSKEYKEDDASSEDVLEGNHEIGSSDVDEGKDGPLEDAETENNEESSEEANFISPLVNDSGIPRTPDTCGETNLPEKARREDISTISNGFRAPIEDTQDLFCNSQLSCGEDPEKNSNSTQGSEDVDTALLRMDLKLDSPPDDDKLFDEDDNKENVDPSPSKPPETLLYSKGAPVKAFVDDEAEDEDEDVLVGPSDEDDSDGDENEELQDILATAEEEQPADQSRRDELHRKWLQQQDAAATNDILLRLGCRRKQRGHQPRKTALLGEDNDFGFDDHGDDMKGCNDQIDHYSSASEDLEHGNDECHIEEPEPPLRPTVDDDSFVSSEDEEVEERLMRERVLQESEEQEEFLTPVDDETSRGIFGLIKKVNIAPNGKKKPKPSSVFHEILGSGTNSNGSSKSSFLGKITSSSLQTSHKQGLGASKSYIFGRDDSNSRHGISKTESPEDMDQKENEHASSKSKVSSTQSKFKRYESGNKAAKDANDPGKGPSLFEILRRQTSEMDRTLQSRNTNKSQENRPANIISHFAAFKSFTSIKTLKKSG